MTALDQPAAQGADGLERIHTGSEELDAILGGGFPSNSINILMGEPGSGKTILAERLIFANAYDDERPILYLTTLSEPLDKLVRYLQQFRFFDESRLTDGAIVYDSIGAELAEHGIAALIPKLKDAITTLKPKIIVIDSFKAVHDIAPSAPEMRRMLYQMAGLLTAYETTAFLIGEYGDEHVAKLPEFAVADGMIQLTRSKTSTRDERRLRVLKLRGSAYSEGEHGFRISSDGLKVFPRLVSPTHAPDYQMLTIRCSTGIAGLDNMLSGGPFRGTSTLVEGPTGSGKTTLALQFALESIRRGDGGSLIVNFEENPTQLAHQIRSLGLDYDDAQRKGLQLMYISPVELQIDSIASDIFRFVASGKVQRVVIDSVGDLLMAASDSPRLQRYLYALTQHFAVMGMTSIMTHETSGRSGMHRGYISALADNLVMLGIDVGAKTRRTIRVVKARGMRHDLQERELSITNTGVHVG